jgi:CDP-diacylglycerol---glycerol-3-phosphate 3-phosphatidyltransferase
VTPATNTVFNVPNVLTAARFVLSVVVFVLIPFQYYVAAIITFVIAASTDWIDGWWARKYGQVTKLGRIFDPFVDKIIICGTFIFLAAEPRSGILPWMAVVVMGREMLVTAIRSVIEAQGGDFSASMSGKLKMVFQCIAVVLSLLILRHWQLASGTSGVLAQPPAWLSYSLILSVWLAVFSTVYSGLEYVIAAARILSR